MSEPRRFSEGGAGELARVVVDSVRDEVPPAALRKKVALALGLGAGVVAGATTAAAAAAVNAHAATAVGSAGATGAASATAAAAGASAIGASQAAQVSVAVGLTKWIGVAAATGLAAAGAAGYLQATAPSLDGHRASAAARSAYVQTQASAVAASPPHRPAPTLASPSAEADDPHPVAGTSSKERPSEAPPASGVVGGQAPRSASLRAGTSLSDELRVLDDARAALDAGDTARALTLLGRHDRDFSPPALAPEAMALRIEVYARGPDRESTARLARRFLVLYGDRPEAQRVRSILAAQAEP
jgi:hypothetical protein